MREEQYYCDICRAKAESDKLEPLTVETTAKFNRLRPYRTKDDLVHPHKSVMALHEVCEDCQEEVSIVIADALDKLWCSKNIKNNQEENDD